MADTVQPSSLVRLFRLLEGSQSGDIAPPEMCVPDNAEVLGVAPPSLRIILDAYRRCSDQCSQSAEAKKEAATYESLYAANTRGAPLQEQELLLEEHDAAALAMSYQAAFVDFVWAYFLVEAIQIFPHRAFLEEPWRISIGSDWRVAVDPPEEECAEEEPQSMPSIQPSNTIH